MKKFSKNLIAVFLTLIISFSFAGQVWAVTIDSIELVSKNTAGTLGNEFSDTPMVSSDGRYVFFYSDATNLVANDTNAVCDIFMRDTQLDTTTRISVSTAGAEADQCTRIFSISSDGRYVLFESEATNLVANDTNAVSDVFIRDTQLNTTTRISVSTAGVEGDGYSASGGISSNGRYVAFYSDATNLVAGDTNGFQDVFIRDTQLNTTTRVSVSTAGAQGNNSSSLTTISNDGRYVAMLSGATNLVANDTNSQQDIFIRDTHANTTIRISVDSNGQESNGDSYLYSYNFEYPYFSFQSDGSNLVANDTNGVQDIFVHNIQTGQTSRVSVSTAGVEGDGTSYYATASSDGRYVFFYSEATNLVANDTNANSDVFVRDTQTNATTRLSMDSNGAEINGYSSSTYVAYSGDYLVYSSDATTLVVGDTNGFSDIFLLSLLYLSTPTTTTTSASSITTTTAVLTGNITDTGGEANTERGFDIGTDNTYTMSDIEDATGSYSTGSYSLTATGLTCGTTYYYRAYSTNTTGTGTGSDSTFTTSACPSSSGSSGSSASSRASNLINMGKIKEAQEIINQFPTQTQNVNTNTNPTTPKPTNTPTVRKGNRNNEVKYIQEYLKIKADGIFGPITQKAVIEFQKQHNLVPDGVVGPRTWGVMK